MRFYTLEQFLGGDADTRFTTEIGVNVGDARRCPECQAFVGMLAWLPPFRVELELYGKEFGDFAFMMGVDDFLVSQKFREMYYQHGLTGLVGFNPVDVFKVRSKSRRKMTSQPPKYFRVFADYSQTALDLAACGMEWLEQPRCRHCYTATIVRWKRLVIKDSTWTGADIFRPRGKAGETMVAQRFKEVCQRYAIKNAVFLPAEKSSHDYYPGMVTEGFRAPQ